MTGRFAPSPTGRMHLGNIYSALLSWLSAKSSLTSSGKVYDGEWLLRIEDIDPQRSKQQWADLIMEDLEWFGLTWDKGPFYQSQRGEIYEHYLNILKSKGLIYPSYKTRAERLAVSAPQADDKPVAPMAGQKPADAFRVEDSIVTYTDGHYGPQTINLKQDIGDFIVRRRDGAWAYQLAVVVDDALMGVTEVVRGCDLLQSAAQQIYLGDILGFSQMHYTHLPLLCNNKGQRLSKRDKSLDMSVLRQCYSAEEIIGRLAYYAGIIPELRPVTASELIPLFSWEKVSREKKIIVDVS